MIKMSNVLHELSRERPIFHSEADFQHAVAWQIHERWPELNMRLERRIDLNDRKNYVDICIHETSNVVIIETKYKTKGANIALHGEDFILKNQLAHLVNRYGFVKDVSRIEECLTTCQEGYGFAVFLTNDASYWREPRNTDPLDKDFRIHEGRTIRGELSWKEGTSEGTMRGREVPVKLRGQYTLNWEDYSVVEDQGEKFRFLLVRVVHGTIRGTS